MPIRQQASSSGVVMLNWDSIVKVGGWKDKTLSRSLSDRSILEVCCLRIVGHEINLGVHWKMWYLLSSHRSRHPEDSKEERIGIAFGDKKVGR
jgi:hypothetical protein